MGTEKAALRSDGSGGGLAFGNGVAGGDENVPWQAVGAAAAGGMTGALQRVALYK